MSEKWDARYLAVFDSYGFDDKAINDDFGGRIVTGKQIGRAHV